MDRILVVDDDKSILGSFDKLLRSAGYSPSTARSGEQALELIARSQPQLVLLDVRMPGMDGLETLRRIKELDARVPVIVMTAHSTTDAAIEATRHGAFDYHVKPLDPDALLRTIESALTCERLARREVLVNPENALEPGDAIIGQSPEMLAVYKAIGKVAATDVTVLIQGETGTGKELVARAIHQHGTRRDGPLLTLNCTAVPETLLESELFGYERGAFTGAASRRLGKFELANGGTLLLDEIGDVPPASQAKLLRVLQEQTVERLGGERTISVNVRVLAATNKNLLAEIEAGRFREDLYHRLSVFTIELPPLKNRRQDIPALIDHFARSTARSLGTADPVWAEDARELLLGHSWPGNVRELENCIQRAMIQTAGAPIRARDIEILLHAPSLDTSGARSKRASLRDLVIEHLRTETHPDRHLRFIEEVDRLLVVEALRSAEGNQTHAARLLGLSRPTLQAKMQKFNIQRETSVRE